MLLPVLLSCTLALAASPTPGAPSDAGPAAARVTAVHVQTSATGTGTRVEITAPADAAGSVRLLADGRVLADLPLVDGRASLTTNAGAPAEALTACVLTGGSTGSCTTADPSASRPGSDGAAPGRAAGVPVTVTIPSGGLVLSSPTAAATLRTSAGGRAVGVADTLLTDTRPGRTTTTVVLSVEGDGVRRGTRVVPLRPTGLPGNALDPRAFVLGRASELPAGGGTAVVARRPASTGAGAVRLAARIEVETTQPVVDRGHDPSTSPVTVVWTAF